MTDQQVIPEWSLGDRLRKAREHAHLSQEELADALEVSRSTVGRWEKGEPMKRAFVREWAERCGASFTWLAGPGDLQSQDSVWVTGDRFPAYAA